MAVQIKSNSYESTQNKSFFLGADVPDVYMHALMLCYLHTHSLVTILLVYPNLLEGADSVDGADVGR